jgi:hypothetical protein
VIRLALWGIVCVAVALFALRVAGTGLAAPFAVAVVVTAWLMDRIAA